MRFILELLIALTIIAIVICILKINKEDKK